MSSPGFGPFQPMMEDLRNKGSRAVNMLSAPGQTIHDLLMPPTPHPDTSWHDQMVNQANQIHVNAQAPQQGVLTQAAKKPRQ